LYELLIVLTMTIFCEQTTQVDLILAQFTIHTREHSASLKHIVHTDLKNFFVKPSKCS